MSDEKVFLDKEELDQVKSIRNDAHLTFIKLGKLRVELTNYLKESEKRVNDFETAEETLLKQHSELQERETRVIDELRNKYGEGELNPETGEFTPTK